ncbi:MAG: class I SAM-dependent methyltransferase [Desulfitobacterium hafniense]|nr:class I SAM-dependent methyltransferase [Desulfitobacterium hafniense]
MNNESNKTNDIRQIYNEYETNEGFLERWHGENPGNKAILNERIHTIRKMLEEYGYHDLKNLRILDLGCGRGIELARLSEWGARPENLHGVDILQHRIDHARHLYPKLTFSCQDASNLSYSDEEFDLITMFTIMSSILDDEVRIKVAREASRVLKPGGAIIWYDNRYDNPRNPHTRKISKRSLQNYFPDFDIHAQSITVLPPIVRRLGKATKLIYPVLGRFGCLRTHYLAIIKKRP